MPVVPKYQEQGRLAPLPDLTTKASPAPFAAAAAGAGELGEAGRGLTRLGDALFIKAEREREENERVEFMKLRALREAEVDRVVQQESESDDYETMADRVNAAMADYDKKTADGLRGKRMQKLYGNLVEVGNASLAPKLAGLREKRRADVLSADAALAVNTAIENKRWEEAQAYTENVPGTVWSAEKKAQIRIGIEKAQKEEEKRVSAQALGPDLYARFGGDLEKARDFVRSEYSGQDEEYFLRAVEGYFTDKRQDEAAARDKVCDAAADMLNHKAGYSKISAYLAQNEALLGPRLFRRLKDDAEREYGVGRYAPRAVYGGRGGGAGSGRTVLPPAAKMALFYKAKEELMAGKYKSAAEFAEAYADAGFSYTDLQRLAYPVFGKNGAGSGSGGKDKFNKFNALSVVTKMTKDYGLDESPEEEMAFWGAFSAACQDKEKEKKAPLSNEEMVGVARDMFTQRVITAEYSKLGKGLKKIFGWDIGASEETTAYGYQIKAEELAGRVSIGDSTGVPYTVDEEGNIRGWKPDGEGPKLRSSEKRSIKAEDFYPEKPVKKEDLFPYADIRTEEKKEAAADGTEHFGIPYSITR